MTQLKIPAVYMRGGYITNGKTFAGSLSVGANAVTKNGEWTVVKAVMSRSARRLMEGWVRVSI